MKNTFPKQYKKTEEVFFKNANKWNKFEANKKGQ